MAVRRPTLVGARLALRPGSGVDAERLEQILREPSVASWWGEPEPVTRIAEALSSDTAEEVLLVIDVGGDVAGAIQYWEEPDARYRHAAIDIYLGQRYQNRGLGTEAIRLLARFLFGVRAHHRLSIDPAVDNARAVRAYESVGFRPVGVMRRYERRADGSFRDGLLMDMLRGELR